MRNNCLCQVFGILLLMFMFWPGLIHAAGNLTQNSSRECAICHFRWMDQFVAGHGTELTPLETEDVAGAEMMCFSCHDGSTDDSRTRIWRRDRHRTGMVPSDKVRIPKLFPLSPQGEMVCATCHSAHSVPTDTSIERTIFLRVSSHESQMCEMCHYAQGDKSLINHPLHSATRALPEAIFAAGGVVSDLDEKRLICESCHTAHGGLEHKNLLFEAGNSTLCILCHTEKTDGSGASEPEGRNHPLAIRMENDDATAAGLYVGENRTLQCLSCHKVHSRDPAVETVEAEAPPGEKTVDRIVRLPASDSRLCLACHAKRYTSAGESTQANHPIGMKLSVAVREQCGLYVGPGESMQCLSCHKVHGHNPGSRALALAPDALCASCHSGQKGVAGTDHDLAVTAPTITNSKGQSAGESGVCGSCHLPHGAQGSYLWAREVKGSGATVSQLCGSCHDKGGAAKEKGVGVHTHPVEVAVKNSTPLPLFSGKAGVPVMTCSTCHDPHQWSPVTKTGAAKLNREGDGSSSFLRLAVGSNKSLCASCHEDKYRIEDTDHDLRLTAPDIVNTAGATVTESGVCSSCHVPHNGSGPLLWARPASGIKTRAELCVDCHRPDGPAGEKTVGQHSHPVDVAVKGETKLPLIQRDDGKTIMGCFTCHDPHQWRADTMQRGPGKKVEGGESDSFLRRSNLKSPLLCSECHAAQSGVSGSQHDMSRTAPDSRNMHGRKPEEGSVCAPCHAVHNSLFKPLLWNGPVSSGDDYFMDRVCNGCHSSNQAGEKKIVATAKHPRAIYFGYGANSGDASSEGGSAEDDIRLYTQSGGQSASGAISCPTCHDAHVWYQKVGSGDATAEREGNIIDSFLRDEVRQELCYACHGLTTLELFRFYHDEKNKRAVRGKTLPHAGIGGDRVRKQ
jgi:predicted CXXCH cytochrome family protein